MIWCLQRLRVARFTLVLSIIVIFPYINDTEISEMFRYSFTAVSIHRYQLHVLSLHRPQNV